MKLQKLTLLCILFSAGVFAQVPYVNFEIHPSHPLDLSPDGRTLAVAHTADARVQLFDTSEGQPVPIGHVVVGIDPVSVRFRSDSELWVVNHISDSVSIIDLATRTVVRTLATKDEPFDVVFANDRAFVSCSQVNTVQVFDLTDLVAAPQNLNINAEEPKGLAVNGNGSKVFVAIFESGNGSTILGGGLDGSGTLAVPNVVNDANTPYGGQNPPPNMGTVFDPPMTVGLTTPPRVGLIVKQDNDGAWMDDNDGDWTAVVSGVNASQSGRPQGWQLIDNDLAVIDTTSLDISYVSGLMNIGMAVAYNPGNGEITLVGTDATNLIRFEPKVNGRFLRVNMARVDAENPATKAIIDLNPHLDYSLTTIVQAQRDLSLGDPRAIVWQADGQRGYIAGMGSNNIIVVDNTGRRVTAIDPIEVGEGPAGLALNAAYGLLYVWNHFDASLSVIDTGELTETDRIAVFNPLPQAIRDGRRFLYNTHDSSGLGHIACASCHVDARMDRLAWDLGDPSGEVKLFEQNCITELIDGCEDYHPMKGPMVTQTLQNIIGLEPLHWRGDRTGIEEFNGAFESLQGDDTQLSSEDMQAFKDFLATITFPPNPFRLFDNSLPESVDLNGHYTAGRFAPAGQPLGTGNAVQGLALYTDGLLDTPFHCVNCHTLPTGMAANETLIAGLVPLPAGGEELPLGPDGENHLGIVSLDGSTNRSIKVPQLRNAYDKVGMNVSTGESLAGFGFLHDGSVDSLSQFLSSPTFGVTSDQQVADLVAFMLAFSGSDLIDENPASIQNAPLSQDSHAAVGKQLTIDSANVPTQIDQMLALADDEKIDVTVHAGAKAWTYDPSSAMFLGNDAGMPLDPASLLELADGGTPQTWSVVPLGLGTRLALDRDGDGLSDLAEIAMGSNPADKLSSILVPRAGIWLNAERIGHGFDLQLLGGSMFITWYTYEEDGSPTWYQAVGAFNGSIWTAQLLNIRQVDGGFVGDDIGSITLTFSDATHATFDWTVGDTSGSEPFRLELISSDRTVRDYTANWYDPTDIGWGLTIYTQGDVRATVVYFYDGQGNPRWVLGIGDNPVTTTTSMQSFIGYCPSCDYVNQVSTDAGTVSLNLDQLRSGTLSMELDISHVPNATWSRQDITISALSERYLDMSGF